MDLDCRDTLQRVAAHTLIAAERCTDRHIQARLVEIANELIELMVDPQLPRKRLREQTKLN
jgi:hypothetical protein